MYPRKKRSICGRFFCKAATVVFKPPPTFATSIFVKMRMPAFSEIISEGGVNMVA
jgi:hypothetical protein